MFNAKGLSRQNGQTITEMLIVMLVFFALVLGIFEMTYIYKAKVSLNTATFEAARAGSLNHARLDPMQTALVKGMTPLYTRGTNIGSLGAGFVRAKARFLAFDNVPLVSADGVRIISPTKAVFDKFAVEKKTELVGSGLANRTVIPNDHLLYRDSSAEAFGKGKDAFKLNIQDANLLKIKTFWCYEMKAPLLRTIINDIVSGGAFGIFSVSSEQRACNAMDKVFGSKSLAIVSQSVIRMQSHIVYENNNLR